MAKFKIKKVVLNLFLLIQPFCYQQLQASIKVIYPENFQKEFKNATIDTTYANFGRVPYGDKFLGEIVWSDIDPSGCSQ